MNILKSGPHDLFDYANAKTTPEVPLGSSVGGMGNHGGALVPVPASPLQTADDNLYA